MANNSTQEYINKAQNNPVEFVKALLDFSKSANEQQAASKVLDAQDKTAQTRTAYQLGVEKAQKEAGYTHGMEYIQAGGDPNKLNDHPSMQNSSQDGMAALKSILPSLDDGQFVDSQKSDVSNGIMNQVKSVTNPSNPMQHPVGALLNLIGNMTGVSAVNAGIDTLRLNNMEKAQAITGTEQIQPKESATFRAGQNTAQLDALKSSAEQLQKQYDSLNTEFTNEEKTITAGAKLGNLITFQGQNMTPRMKEIVIDKNRIAKNLGIAQYKLSKYLPKNPMATKGGNAPKGRVLVINPDGTEGHIPESQLSEALKAGFKRAE